MLICEAKKRDVVDCFFFHPLSEQHKEHNKQQILFKETQAICQVTHSDVQMFVDECLFFIIIFLSSIFHLFCWISIV